MIITNKSYHTPRHSVETSLVSQLSGLHHIGSSTDSSLTVYAPWGGTVDGNAHDQLSVEIAASTAAKEPAARSDKVLQDVRDVVAKGGLL